ncbi:MAG: biotin--[acetyl-CoA-carboxylase] ligase [Pseudomonadota bacterium]
MSPRLLAVLRQLSHAEFRSGQDLAAQLACSRASVHGAVAEAQALGVPIHALRGRGYRLAAPLSWLDGEQLDSALGGRGMSLRLFDEQESTNTTLMRWAQAGAPHRAVVAAEWQTRGRGRRGRDWLGGLGGSLAFSLLWRSTRPASGLSGLSLAVGVALVRALRGLGVSGAQVKWPNDVLVAEAKLAGVLIELTGDVLGPSAAVIGVGINVAGGALLTDRLGLPVTDVQAHAGPLDRNQLLLALLAELDGALHHFEQEGFPVFRTEWQACHAHRDQRVRIDMASGEGFSGLARGVDEQGALLVDTGTGMRHVHSGEVSLRRVAS